MLAMCALMWEEAASSSLLRHPTRQIDLPLCRPTTYLQVIELSDTAFYPDQIHRLSRMRILMGVHGAGLGNMIWMEPERGGVVEIMVSQGHIERGREAYMPTIHSWLDEWCSWHQWSNFMGMRMKSTAATAVILTTLTLAPYLSHIFAA